MSPDGGSVGFFGGSFDPIHNGHLNLAIELSQRAGLTKILFCPTNVSPFKLDTPPKASAEDRCRMVELAIEDIPEFELCELEVNRPPPSYTVETLRELGGDLHLIIASDSLEHFFSWECADEIISLAPPIIGTRHGHENKNFTRIPKQYQDAFKKGFYEIPQMEISSTALRDYLANKRICSHLIPAKVLDYIYSNRLY